MSPNTGHGMPIAWLRRQRKSRVVLCGGKKELQAGESERSGEGFRFSREVTGNFTK